MFRKYDKQRFIILRAVKEAIRAQQLREGRAHGWRAGVGRKRKATAEVHMASLAAGDVRLQAAECHLSPVTFSENILNTVHWQEWADRCSQVVPARAWVWERKWYMVPRGKKNLHTRFLS